MPISHGKNHDYLGHLSLQIMYQNKKVSDKNSDFYRSRKVRKGS